MNNSYHLKQNHDVKIVISCRNIIDIYTSMNSLKTKFFPCVLRVYVYACAWRVHTHTMSNKIQHFVYL